MSSVFKVSKSGYYDWCRRDNSEREARELKLLRAIEEVHKSSHGSYGSPRIYRMLKTLGYGVSKAKVERVMKEEGIRSKTQRKFRVTTDSNHKLPVAPNLLNREFSPEKPDQVWASDITYISTKEGWLYLAVVVDLFSRQVVGWSMDKTMTRELVLTALRRAYFKRKPSNGLIFHSDRGSQYCSEELRLQLSQYLIIQSQSRRANCWDNACVESFFHSLKVEMIYQKDFMTQDEAYLAVFDWIEAFYNRKRLHSTLGYLSPVDFERIGREKVA